MMARDTRITEIEFQAQTSNDRTTNADQRAEPLQEQLNELIHALGYYLGIW